MVTAFALFVRFGSADKATLSVLLTALVMVFGRVVEVCDGPYINVLVWFPTMFIIFLAMAYSYSAAAIRAARRDPEAARLVISFRSGCVR